MLGAVFEHQLGLRAVFADDVMITKCERPIQEHGNVGYTEHKAPLLHA